MSRIDDLVNGIYPLEDSNDSNTICKRVGFRQGYEQALKDMKETFEQMSKNTNSAIDAIKAIGSLLDNPDIREKLGKSKPIPKKPIKTNSFFGGEKK